MTTLLAGQTADIQTPLSIQRYPDHSALADCGPWSLVLAWNDPVVNDAIDRGFPWSVSLNRAGADETIVVFVAPEPTEADWIFTNLAGYLAGYDNSRSWEEHIAGFLTE
jgi:hypothetical protein